MADRLRPLKMQRPMGDAKIHDVWAHASAGGLNESGLSLACIPSPAEVAAHDWG